MSLQVQVQKALSQYDFLTSSMYEVNDLTNSVGLCDKFVVRQGDLIIAKHPIDNYRQKGLRLAWKVKKGGIYRFMGSHIVIPQEDKTILIHNEHGIVIIPKPTNELEFYTFSDAGD